MIYVILGGPATGKGTRSKILAKELNIPHISTGELLRQEALNNEEINTLLSNGELISDDIINEILYKRVKKQDCDNGFVLDGYPRKIEQVYALEAILRKINKNITKAIELVIPESLAFKRILERKKCDKCGKIYGIDFPPKKENTCDDCQGRLQIRSDDTEETLKKRIDTYNKLSKPILDYYRKKNLLKTVDSSNCPERILGMIE